MQYLTFLWLEPYFDFSKDKKHIISFVTSQIHFLLVIENTLNDQANKLTFAIFRFR